MFTPDLDADTALVADLNRLLREGLVSVGWEDMEAPPRFYVTPRGRQVLEETDDDDHPRADRSGDAMRETTQR